MRSINIGVLDELVWDTLVKNLSDSHLRKEEVKKKVLDGKRNDGIVKSYTKEIQSLNRELQDLEKQSTRLMRLFTSGRIDEGQFDDEYSIPQERTTELQKNGDGIQSQLNLIDDPQQWISWLDEFDTEVDELVYLKDDNGKRERF